MKLPLGQFFESNLGNMAAKVLGSIGVGLLSFAAIKTAFDLAVSYARSQYDSIAVDALGLIGLAGIGEAIGLIVGAMTFKVAFSAGSKLGVIPK